MRADVLRELIAREAKVLADGPAFAELSTRFDLPVIELAGNQTLAFLAAMLHDIIEMHVESSIERNFAASAIGGAVHSQQRLVGLIEAGDADGAERHGRAHVRDTV